MDKITIERRLEDLEFEKQELMELYTNINETDAEIIKKRRLRSIQVEIGQKVRRIKELSTEGE